MTLVLLAGKMVRSLVCSGVMETVSYLRYQSLDGRRLLIELFILKLQRAQVKQY